MRSALTHYQLRSHPCAHSHTFCLLRPFSMPSSFPLCSRCKQTLGQYPRLCHSSSTQLSLLCALNACRFMKLRLDRVMRFDLVDMTEAEALAVGGKVPEFKPPAKWTAPYPPYSSGWWEKFLPGAVNKA